MSELSGNTTVELSVAAPYRQAHPWVVQAITGFLSAYFMEHTEFRVQRHADDPETGMHVWLVECPASLKMGRLLKRLQADIPPCSISEQRTEATARPRYILENPAS